MRSGGGRLYFAAAAGTIHDMSVSAREYDAAPGRAPRVICGAWVAGTACVLLAVGVDAYSGKPRSFPRASALAWAAPIHEAAIFSASSPDSSLAPSDQTSAVGGSRFAAGSAILIATIVHADVLEEIAVSRIGGLYGP
jgi:hypothetical protein